MLYLYRITYILILSFYLFLGISSEVFPIAFRPTMHSFLRSLSIPGVTCSPHLTFLHSVTLILLNKPVPMAARSKAQVCGRSPAEIVSSNPAEGMDVCLLVLCVVK